MIRPRPMTYCKAAEDESFKRCSKWKLQVEQAVLRGKEVRANWPFSKPHRRRRKYWRVLRCLAASAGRVRFLTAASSTAATAQAMRSASRSNDVQRRDSRAPHLTQKTRRQ